MLQNNSSSLQVMLIRQIQIDEGHAPCYATNYAAKCAHNRTPEGCCWSHDCSPEQTEFNHADKKITHCM